MKTLIIFLLSVVPCSALCQERVSTTVNYWAMPGVNSYGPFYDFEVAGGSSKLVYFTADLMTAWGDEVSLDPMKEYVWSASGWIEKKSGGVKFEGWYNPVADGALAGVWHRIASYGERASEALNINMQAHNKWVSLMTNTRYPVAVLTRQVLTIEVC